MKSTCRLMIVLSIPLLFATGCIGNLFGINLTAVGEKTALERQVLGTYEQIGRDLSVYASVRGVAPDGSMKEPPTMTDSQLATMAALNNRRYNRDDLDILLTQAAVGEANTGLVEIRDETTLANVSIGAELARQIIEEENRDRATIIERLVATTPGASPQNASDIAWIFATLNHDLALPGTPIQNRDGSWTTK